MEKQLEKKNPRKIGIQRNQEFLIFLIPILEFSSQSRGEKERKINKKSQSKRFQSKIPAFPKEFFGGNSSKNLLDREFPSLAGVGMENSRKKNGNFFDGKEEICSSLGGFSPFGEKGEGKIWEFSTFPLVCRSEKSGILGIPWKTEISMENPFPSTPSQGFAGGKNGNFQDSNHPNPDFFFWRSFLLEKRGILWIDPDFSHIFFFSFMALRNPQENPGAASSGKLGNSPKFPKFSVKTFPRNQQGKTPSAVGTSRSVQVSEFSKDS